MKKVGKELKYILFFFTWFVKLLVSIVFHLCYALTVIRLFGVC